MEKCSVFYAHSTNENQENWEFLLKHLNNVAEKTGNFCEKFGFGDIGKVAGLLHDLGKYQKSFQNKLLGKNIKLEHSICGAKEALKVFPRNIENPMNFFNREMLAYIIAGHHSGLPDFSSEDNNTAMSTLSARLKREVEDFSAYKNELSINNKFDNFWTKEFNSYDNSENPFAISILTRMLFSALVDADSLETEKFYTGKDRVQKYDLFKDLKQKLNEKFASFPEAEKESLNEKRNEIKKYCEEKANLKKGLFSLTVPTGGGKTLSSAIFAVNHLLKNGHQRIIYVIPYTAIIDQIAKEFKEIFGEENVVEHHSNFTPEDNAGEDTPKFLATENWDAPIILTTNVQFFESLFSNKRGNCRKLHNIANSVIVFDEVQMLPIPLLKPCLKTIDILTRNFGCSALLMSATCPNYLPYMCKDAKITEINDNFINHYFALKRTSAEYIGKKTDSELIESIDKNSQTLVVVNSRKHARALFELLTDCNKYHLSTLMFPKHRKRTLQKIKEDLLNNKPCIVISTQLIECGVDLDFQTVYRSLAGIDSIVQAGGRCNREGKRADSKVYIFESDADPKRGDIPIYQSLARYICQNPENNDIFALENIKKYFVDLLKFKDKETDDHKILELFNIVPVKNSSEDFYLQFGFATCNERFKYIEPVNKYDIIIPYDEDAKKLLNQVKRGEGNLKLAYRKLGQYIVSVYSYEYQKLVDYNKLELLMEGNRLTVLKDCEINYDEFLGLLLLDSNANKGKVQKFEDEKLIM